MSKVAVITGSSRGIGKAIALELAACGYDIALTYMSQLDQANEVAQKIKKMGRKAESFKLHLGDSKSRENFYNELNGKFSQVDVLVANAATGVFRQAKDLSLNSLTKVLNVNFLANLELCQEIIKKMKPGSSILAISSLGAERVIGNYGSIGTSKAALEAMIRQFAVELGPSGITCNVIRAGLVDTGILDFIPQKDKVIADTKLRTPAGRIVTPEDVAKFVGFISSKNARMITGQTLTVDGGFSLVT